MDSDCEAEQVAAYLNVQLGLSPDYCAVRFAGRVSVLDTQPPGRFNPAGVPIA